MQPYAPFTRAIRSRSNEDLFCRKIVARYGKRNDKRAVEPYADHRGAARQQGKRDIAAEFKAFLAIRTSKTEGSVVLTDSQVRHQFGTHAYAKVWAKKEEVEVSGDRFLLFDLPEEYDALQITSAYDYEPEDDGYLFDIPEPMERCELCGRYVDLCGCDDMSYEESFDYEDFNEDHWKTPYCDKLSDHLWRDYELLQWYGILDAAAPTWQELCEEQAAIDLYLTTGKMQHFDECCCQECERSIWAAA